MLDKTTKILYAIALGEVSKVYGNTWESDELIKELQDRLSITINVEDIHKVIAEVLSEPSLSTWYSKAKEGILTTEDYLKVMGKGSVDKYVYLNSADELVTISKESLAILTGIYNELSMSVGSNKAPLTKVFRLAHEEGAKFEESQGLLELIESFTDREMPIQDSTTDKVSDWARDSLGQINIAKRGLQTKSNQLNKVKRLTTDSYLFREELLEASKASVLITPKDFSGVNFVTSHNTLVIPLADWHIGASFDLNNLNKYNPDIATNLITKFTEEISRYINIYKPSEVKLIHLGDIVENTQLRVNQAYSVSMNLGQQIVHAETLQDNLVVSLVQSFPDVHFTYTNIQGNHDRMSPNKKDGLPYDGVATVVRHSVELSTVDYSNVDVLNPDTEYRTSMIVNNIPIIGVHGDLDNLDDKNILASLSQYNGTTYKLVLGGHKHSNLIREVQGGFIFQVGSVIGSTDYSDMLKLSASRSQGIVLIDSVGNIRPNIVTL